MYNALFALENHDGLVDLAQKLIARDFAIYATLPTVEYLRKHAVPVMPLPHMTRAGSYRNHELLQTDLFDAVLSDEEWIQWPKFDLVCTDLSESTDVAHSVLLMTAIEGKRIPLLSVKDCEEFLRVYDHADGETIDAAYKSRVWQADLGIAAHRLRVAAKRSGHELFHVLGMQSGQPAYGENPHQASYGFYEVVGAGKEHDPLAIFRYRLVKGAALSHNNYLDISRAVDVISRIAAVHAHNSMPVECIAVGVKHGSVCGAAHTDHQQVALRNMIDGQPQDLFGGVVMVNFKIDSACARVLLTHATDVGRVLDVVVAPSVTAEARALLSRKNDKCRMLENEALLTMNAHSMEKGSICTMIRGGMLVQESPQFIPHCEDVRLQFSGEWPLAARADMLLAWAVGSASLSNSITLVRDAMLVGNGVAATSRIDACRRAVVQAGDRAKAAVAYSDSFFPFVDGVDVLADSGVQYIFASDGSRMDAKVKKKIRERGIQACFVADTIGRGFRH